MSSPSIRGADPRGVHAGLHASKANCTSLDKPIEERERNFHEDLAVVLGPAGAGAWYRGSFWLGHFYAIAAWSGAFAALFLGCRELRDARSRTIVAPEDE